MKWEIYRNKENILLQEMKKKIYSHISGKMVTFLTTAQRIWKKLLFL